MKSQYIFITTLVIISGCTYTILSPTKYISPLNTFQTSFTKPITATPSSTLDNTNTPTLLFTPIIDETPSIELIEPVIGGGSGWIVYSYEPNEYGNNSSPQIMKINIVDQNIIQLTNSFGYSEAPNWSPDGEIIVYAYTDINIGKPTTIYTINADGTDAKILIKEPFIETNPVWSPNGDFIAFDSLRASDNPYHCMEDCIEEVYLMNSDGSDVKRITFNNGFAGKPSWTRDGQKLIYSTNKEGNTDLFMVNIDGTNEERITTNPSIENEPSLSPDGEKIAFVSNREGPFTIYLLDINENNVQRLVNSKGWNITPIWSPDGKFIVFLSSRDDPNAPECKMGCNFELYVMKSNGTNVIQLTNTPGRESSPSWQPRVENQ